MAIIQPEHKGLTHRVYSAPLRFWHWANTIVISGSLITVLINSTITDRRTVSTIVKTQLKAQGATITDDQSGSVAHALGDSVWSIHT